MTDKQYADIATMMMYGRIFADQMYKCLVNSGLLDEGYVFQVSAGKGYDLFGATLATDVDICKGAKYKDWRETRFLQMRMKDGVWIVYDDPKERTGSIPPVVITVKKDGAVKEAVGANAEKPYPPDGLWIGAFNHDSDVGGGK